MAQCSPEEAQPGQRENVEGINSRERARPSAGKCELAICLNRGIIELPNAR
jgi:hypothetical protein